MIRLHVVHDQEVRLPAVERLADVAEPGAAEMSIYRVQHGDLLIQDRIGVVAYAFRDGVQPLEQVDGMVIDAQVADIISNA